MHDGVTPSRTTVRSLQLLLLAGVLLQRFAVPLGSATNVSVCLILLWLGVALLALRGELRANHLQLGLYLVSGLALCLASWASSSQQVVSSAASLLLLLLLYLPWVFEFGSDTRALSRELTVFFVRLMAMLGVVGFIQLTIQWVGLWTYRDPISVVTPEAWLTPGYNTANEIAWNNPIVKGQAFVFLEPSLMSQYCAFALLAVVILRLSWLYLIPLLLGIVGTLSGTGIILAVVGFAVLAARHPRTLRPGYLAIGGAGLVGVLLSPAAELLVGRLGEFGQGGSSGSLRFVEPYLNVWQGLAADPVRVLIGAGPGAADRLLVSARGDLLGQPVVYHIPAKLLFEYGALAAAVFLVFLLVCLVGKGSGPVLGVAMVVMLGFLSGSLLQPSTLLLAWLLVVTWPRLSRIPLDQIRSRRNTAQTATSCPGPDRVLATVGANHTVTDALAPKARGTRWTVVATSGASNTTAPSHTWSPQMRSEPPGTTPTGSHPMGESTRDPGQPVPGVAARGAAPGPDPSQDLPGSAGSRAAWTFTDQALSSLTNAALTILVGRSVDATAFGAFAVAFLIFTFTIGVSRTTITDPLMIRFSASAAEPRTEATSRATAMALILGLVVGICSMSIGLLIGLDHVLGQAICAVGFALPGLLLQDAWRYAFFADGRPRRAALNDLVWAVIQFSGIFWLLSTDHVSVFTLILVWGASAWVAAFFGIWQSSVVPAVARAFSWMSQHRALSWRLGADYAVNQGAYNIANVAITPVASIEAVGALGAGRTLLGPLNLLYSGTTSFVLPHMVRSLHAGTLRRMVLLTSAALGLLTAVWTLVLRFMPTSWGEFLLKENWAGAHSVLLPLGWLMLMVGVCYGPSLGLRARAEADRLLRVTMIQAPLQIVLGVSGAWLGGAVGAAWGFALVQTIGLGLMVAQYRASERAQALGVAEGSGT